MRTKLKTLSLILSGVLYFSFNASSQTKNAYANTISSVYSAIIKLTLTGGNNMNDETVICFGSSASNNFNASEDSIKVFPTDEYANSISSVCDTMDLAYNSLHITNYSVAIRVKVGVTGKFIITKHNSSILPLNTCLYLEDLVTNAITDLGPFSTDPYSFAISDTTNAPRFVLHIGKPSLKVSFPPTCSYTQNAMAIIAGEGSGPWNIKWKNSLGKTIAGHKNITIADTLKNLNSGKYYFEIKDKSGICPVLTDSITIDIVNPIKVNPIISHVNCKNEKSGSIDVSNITGVTTPLTYKWSNGDTTKINSNIGKGIYMLVITDAKGCSDATSHYINQISNLSLMFNTSADSINTTNCAITFSNLTTGHTSVSWDFGDGSPVTHVYNPTHTFKTQGTYTIELTANDDLCYDTLKKIIVVQNSNGINSEKIDNKNIMVYSFDGKAFVNFNLEKNTDVVLKVLTIEGKLINSKQLSAFKNTEEIELGNGAAIYIIHVEISGQNLIKKLIK